MIRDLYAKLPKHAPEYRAWVRSQPSAASGMIGCVAHHRIGGRYSQHKVSDFETMPLTDEEHRELHASMSAFVEKYGKTEAEMINATLLEAIRLGVFAFDARAAKELA
jgi:hypothetical protein